MRKRSEIYFCILAISMLISTHCFAGVYAFIPNSADNTVNVIPMDYTDRFTLRDDLAPFAVEVGKNPYGVAISPDKKYVFIANSDENSISVIDTDIDKDSDTDSDPGSVFRNVVKLNLYDAANKIDTGGCSEEIPKGAIPQGLVATYNNTTFSAIYLFVVLQNPNMVVGINFNTDDESNADKADRDQKIFTCKTIENAQGSAHSLYGITSTGDALYLTDVGGNKLWKILQPSYENPIMETPSSFSFSEDSVNGPKGIANDSKGRLVTANSTSNNVSILAPSSTNTPNTIDIGLDGIAPFDVIAIYETAYFAGANSIAGISTSAPPSKDDFTFYPLPNSGQPGGLGAVINKDRKFLFVTEKTQGKLYAPHVTFETDTETDTETEPTVSQIDFTDSEIGLSTPLGTPNTLGNFIVNLVPKPKNLTPTITSYDCKLAWSYTANSSLDIGFAIELKVSAGSFLEIERIHKDGDPIEYTEKGTIRRTANGIEYTHTEELRPDSNYTYAVSAFEISPTSTTYDITDNETYNIFGWSAPAITDQLHTPEDDACFISVLKN